MSFLRSLPQWLVSLLTFACFAAVGCLYALAY